MMTQKKGKLRWMVPERRKNGPNIFNIPLPENGGKSENQGNLASNDFDADDDIRQGKIRIFESVEDMLDDLENPW